MDGSQEQKVKELSAGEVVGEIRKAARLFEAFKDAERIVRVVLDQESMVADLKRQLEALEGVEDQLNSRLERLDATLAERVRQIGQAETDLANMQAKAEVEAVRMLAEAKKDAQEIIERATVEVEMILSKKESLAGQLADAQVAVQAENQRLQTIKNEIEKYKTSISKFI